MYAHTPVSHVRTRPGQRQVQQQLEQYQQQHTRTIHPLPHICLAFHELKEGATATPTRTIGLVASPKSSHTLSNLEEVTSQSSLSQARLIPLAQPYASGHLLTRAPRADPTRSAIFPEVSSEASPAALQEHSVGQHQQLIVRNVSVAVQVEATQQRDEDLVVELHVHRGEDLLKLLI
mmetsp:Transcript_53122/g.72767  ORF Transcript_53122/g.72767 Transcript_53122/m.72767 type:complete len:177 (+) Transcript_53122:127-657(+)